MNLSKLVAALQPDLVGRRSALQRTEVVVAETVGAGVYTARVPMPAGSILFDIWLFIEGSFAGDTAVIQMGDTVSATRWNPPVTDLKAYAAPWRQDGGFSWGFNNSNQRPSNDNRFPTADELVIIVTTTGAGGATGRLRLMVFGFGITAGDIVASKA